MTQNELKKEIAIEIAIIKAVIYAVLVPTFLAVFFSAVYSPSEGLNVVLGWYGVVSVGYYFASGKKLNAIYYFKTIKYIVLPIVGSYILLIVVAFLISKYY